MTFPPLKEVHAEGRLRVLASGVPDSAITECCRLQTRCPGVPAPVVLPRGARRCGSTSRAQFGSASGVVRSAKTDEQRCPSIALIILCQ